MTPPEAALWFLFIWSSGQPTQAVDRPFDTLAECRAEMEKRKADYLAQPLAPGQWRLETRYICVLGSK